MKLSTKAWLAWFVLAFFIFFPNPETKIFAAKATNSSKKATAPSETKTLSAEDLESFLRMANADAKLKPESKTKIEELVQRAKDALSQSSEWEKKAEDLEQIRVNAPSQIAAFKAEAAREQGATTTITLSPSTLEQLEQDLLRLGAEGNALEKSLRESTTEVETLTSRRLEAPKELGELQQKLDEKETAKVPASNGDSSEPLVIKAQELQKQAFRKMLQAKVLFLQKETESYDIRFDLTSATRENNARLLAKNGELINAVREAVDEKRKQESQNATRAANEALASSTNAHPFIQKLALENADLAKKREELTAALTNLGNNLETGSKLLTTVRDNFKSIKEKVAATGFTDAIGFLLLVKLGGLPSVREFRTRLRKQEDLIAQTQFSIIETKEKLFEFANIPELIEKRFSQDLLGLESSEKIKVEELIKDHLRSQKTFLEALQGDSNLYYARLVDSSALDKRLISVVEESNKFLNENVLWLRSCKPISTSDFERFFQAGKELFSRSRGIILIDAMKKNVSSSPLKSLLVLILIAVFFKGIGRWKNRLDELSVLIVRASTDRVTHPFEALFLTLLVSLPGPILLFTLGLLLGSGEGDEFSRTVGNAVNDTAWLLLGLSFLKKVFYENGLAIGYFRWFVDAVCLEIRHGLGRLIWAGIPFFFLFRVIDGSVEDPLRDSLGRVLYIFFLLAFIWSWNLIFHPASTTMKKIASVNPNRLFYQGRNVLFVFGVILPALMVVGALAGYFYTVQKLFSGMLSSLALGMAAIIAYSFCMRLLLVRRRTLALEKIAARKDAKETCLPTQTHGSEDFGKTEEEGLSINELSAQTQNLVLSMTILAFVIGMWFIWEDLLPALRILDRVQLWSTTLKGAETLTGPEGKIQEHLIDRIVTVSLLDLFIAIFLLSLTFVTSRNVPAFLELTILQRLPLDKGIRFAIGTIASYIVTTLGVIVSFQYLGVYWEKLQWLLAAVSVGLGFGLQEIFANFISGLIILFERPVRVGDLITVSDNTGVVTKIEIRATTIRDADRKEAIIPNKHLITNKVVNWTLSDSIRRLVFRVGASCESKPNRIREVLIKVARDHPRVMKDPAPEAVMVEFGASTLDFELRVFIPNAENFVDFQHSMFAGIEQAFADAGIGIPSPQQDLIVRFDPSSPLRTSPAVTGQGKNDEKS